MTEKEILDAIQEPIHTLMSNLYNDIDENGGEENCPKMKHEINVMSGLEFSILSRLGLEKYHNNSKFARWSKLKKEEVSKLNPEYKNI